MRGLLAPQAFANSLTRRQSLKRVESREPSPKSTGRPEPLVHLCASVDRIRKPDGNAALATIPRLKLAISPCLSTGSGVDGGSVPSPSPVGFDRRNAGADRQGVPRPVRSC